MTRPADHPLLKLAADDLDMVCRFVLASGSVKALANEYSVSYPTIRVRLDQLIERLRGHVERRQIDPVSEQLAELISRGRINPADAERLRELHRAALAAASARQSGASSHHPSPTETSSHDTVHPLR